MSLTDVQNSLHAYMSKKPFFIIMLPFSVIFAFAYPIYLLMTRFDILNPITDIMVLFSALLYFIYELGLLLCFAKKEMVSLSLVFVLRIIYCLLLIITGNAVYPDVILRITIYLILAWLSLKANFSAYNTEEKIHNHTED